MTPYAILLVKPTDDDATVRKAYHASIRTEHPDANEGATSDPWYEATAAYTLIKTAEKRAYWAAAARLLSGTCADCDGCGVKGTRLFKGRIRACEGCGGKGRRVR